MVPGFVKAPEPLLVKLTVPDRVVGLPEVSVTVTVQVVKTPASTELGEQETDVDVVWSGGVVTVRSNVPLLRS